MKLHAPLSFVLLLISIFFIQSTGVAQEKNIVYVASYHVDKGEWTRGIKSGIDSILENRSDIVLHVFNMDTRLSKTEEEKRTAALWAKMLIDQVKPDVVITSDDNAAQYLLLAYYKDAQLPFVFCGLNWDVSVYGLPYQNTTGMIEIQLIGKILEYLTPLARGNRIAALRGDTPTNRKEQMHFEKYLKRTMDTRYVQTFTEWKKEFIRLQDEADLLVLGSLRALDLEGSTMKDVESFILETIKIPTAAYDSFMNRIALLTLSTIPEEQGQWAATKALEIIDGTPPNAIPVTTNRKAKIFLNMKLAKILGVKFPMDLIEISHLISIHVPTLHHFNTCRQSDSLSVTVVPWIRQDLTNISARDSRDKTFVTM